MLRGRRYRHWRNIAIVFFALFLAYKLFTTIHGLLSSFSQHGEGVNEDFNFHSNEHVHLRRQLSTQLSPFDVTKNKRETDTSAAKEVLQPHELLTYVWNVPHIKYLEEFRSPCFYEQRQGLALRKNTVERALTMEGGKYLRCLPYFMLAGFPKCGTTDMYERLTKHKYIASSFNKEPLWWSIARYDHPDFADYLDNFIPAAQKAIVRTGRCKPRDKSSCHPLLIGDFSTRELLQEREPFDHLTGRNTWELIKHVNPSMKFIVLMRDPVERLYSDFVYFSTVGESDRITPQHFHEEVVRQVSWWKSCVNRHSERKCLYGTHVEGMAPLQVMHNACWIETFDNTVCAAFRLGLYYFYIVDWLETFPRDQFLFLSTERYSEFTVDVINFEILQFLNLEAFSGQEEKDIKNMPKQYPLKRDAKSLLKRDHSLMSEMLPDTRAILEGFYRPSNYKLARLLNNTDFLWYDQEKNRNRSETGG